MAEELILPSRYTRNPDGTLEVEEPVADEHGITVLPADDPKELRLGWTITETVGVMIINDYATTVLNMDPEDIVEPVEEAITEIIDVDMSHLFDNLDNRFALMEI